VPYRSASAVVIHYEEALYQVYALLRMHLNVISFWNIMAYCVYSDSRQTHAR